MCIRDSVIGAAVPPFKVDCQDYLEWLRRQPAKYNAKILMNTEATKEMLDKENYDAIIIACGSAPLIPGKIPGINKPHVHWAPDAEEDKSKAGKKLVVIGAGAVGLEAAIEFIDLGKEVDVIEMANEEDATMKLYAGSGTSASEFMKIIKEKPIPVHYETRLVAVSYTHLDVYKRQTLYIVKRVRFCPY